MLGLFSVRGWSSLLLLKREEDVQSWRRNQHREFQTTRGFHKCQKLETMKLIRETDAMTTWYKF